MASRGDLPPNVRVAIVAVCAGVLVVYGALVNLEGGAAPAAGGGVALRAHPSASPHASAARVSSDGASATIVESTSAPAVPDASPAGRVSGGSSKLPWLTPPAEGALERCLANGPFTASPVVSESYLTTRRKRLARCVFKEREAYQSLYVGGDGEHAPLVQLVRRVAYDRATSRFYIAGHPDADATGVVTVPAHDSFLLQELPYFAFHDAAAGEAAVARSREAAAEAGYAGPQVVCTQTAAAAVLVPTIDGGIFDNYWHTMGTFYQLIWWGLYDVEALMNSDPDDYVLFMTHPLIFPEVHGGTKWWDLLPNSTSVRAVGAGRYSVGALFGGLPIERGLYDHLVFTNDAEAPRDGVVCVDRVWVRTAIWNWDSMGYSMCCGDGAVPRDTHWTRRQFTLQRFGAGDVAPAPGALAARRFQLTWISRASAATKHITNEEELMAAAVSYARAVGITVDVVVVDPNIDSEVRVATELARSFITALPHGAASSHAIFLPPGAVEIIIRSKGFKHIVGEENLWFRLIRLDPVGVPDHAGPHYAVDRDDWLDHLKMALRHLYPTERFV